MKRGAEKQLSKDDHSDGEGQDDSPQVGFKKADESVLAARKIRVLPKRASASVASIPPPAPEAPSTKFGSFSGFGSSNTSFSGFGTTNSTTGSQPNLFAPSAQTNTAKSLTSLLSSHNPPSTALSTSSSASSSTSASPFSVTPATTAPQPAFTKKDTTVDPTELKYYTSLRGLNESLRVVISKAIDDDAFADVTVFLERYKSLRADIQKEYDGNKSPTPSTASDATPTSAPVAKTFSMPAPSKEGFLFGGSKVSGSTDTKPSTTSSSGGFVPSFPSSSTTTTTNIFGAPSSTKPKPNGSDPPITSLPFTFGSKPSDGTPVSLFGAKSFEAPKDLVPTPSALAPSSSAPAMEWGTTKSSTSMQPKTEKPAITFGSSSTSTPSFSFGSGSSSSFSLPTNKAADTTAASATGSRFAGFAGFGTTTKAGAASFGFTSSLGITPSSSTLTPTASGSSTGSGTAGADAANDDAPKKNIAESFIPNADNKHDQEGAGEEDEDTAHSVKLKAYIMKDDKGAKSWVELGYGVLRIKKHKETGARRVLLRSSSTGQILINFSFHSALKPTQKGKNVTFLGHDAEGASKMYTLKLQTQEQAAALSEAFDREIRAKES